MPQVRSLNLGLGADVFRLVPGACDVTLERSRRVIRHYYETHGPRDHIHVACLRCGKVREFESRLYEQLKEQIARDFHMKVTVSRTEVGGYCAECLALASK